MAKRKRGRSIEGRLIESARQAVAIRWDGAKPARAYELPRTARETEIPPPKVYTQADVVRIRNRLKLSQAVFAQLLAKSAATIRSWEQGQREPDPSANRLLEIVDRHPEIFLEIAGLAEDSAPARR